MTRAGEAAEGQNGSSIVILILGLAGGFGTLWWPSIGISHMDMDMDACAHGSGVES